MSVQKIIDNLVPIARRDILRLRIPSLAAIDNRLEELVQEVYGQAYGLGVSAGKQEALKYTPEERERYGRWVAQAE